MNLNKLKYKSNYYALILLVFVIPLERKLIAPLTVLFFFTSIINGSFKNIKINYKILFFGVLYLLYTIGFLYTENISTAKSDLMTKLPLLIIPISFAFSNIKWKECLDNISKSFIDGCFASAIIAIIYSSVQFYFNDNSSSFFYGNISLFAHPSYLALMLNMAIVYIYYRCLKSLGLKQIILIIFFSAYIILLASKTGLITMLATHLFFIVLIAIKSKKYFSSVLVIFSLISIVLFAYFYSNTFKTRINDLFTTSTSEINYESSTTARSVIWKICLEKITQKPLIGYGTGDVKNTLMDVYKNRGLTHFLEKKLNAHNQFLQTSLAIGILGGLLLFLMIIIPLYISFKNRHILYLSFLILIIINFFTEAMLERQVGVVFYSVFNSLLFTIYLSKKKLNN